MKIETKPFAKALEIAAEVIERRNTIPILGAAHVAYKDGEIVVSGTDLDTSFQASAPYSGASFNAFTLTNPTAFARLFREGGEELTLDDEGGKLKIQAGKVQGSIQTLPADDWPVFGYNTAGMFAATIGFEQLDMILRVAGAVSTEETRYYLNGVYLHHVEGWTWKAVATDGHRLYIGTLELPDAQGDGIGPHQGEAGGSGGVIIPRRYLNLIRKQRPRMNKAGEILAFGATSGPPSNQPKDLAPEAAQAGRQASRFGMSFWNGDTKVVAATKLIDGTFPDYSRVIPTIDDTMPQVLFRRADMLRAIDAITAGQTERTRAVKLTFEKAGKLSISTKWIDFGFEGKIEIDAKTRVKDPFEIGYNAAYLRQVCEVNDAEEISITASDSNAPGTIVSPGATDFMTVLMPMRV